MTKHYVNSFHFDPAGECYCRSKQAFGDCCGSTAGDRSPPKGITVVNDFVEKVECKKLVRFAEKQEARWLKVIDRQKSTEQKIVERRDPNRVTQVVNMQKRYDLLESTVRRALVDVGSKRYGQADIFEPPYVLRYKVGGVYAEHADSEAFDAQQQRFHRVADRDVSLLIYLNDDYDGGQLSFRQLNYTYKPRAGDLVMFPSSNLFMHQAEQVTRGTKYAVVSWACLRATKKLFSGAAKWPPVKV